MNLKSPWAIQQDSISKERKAESHVERKADFFLHATEIIEDIQQQCSDSCPRKGVTLW